MNSNIFHVLKGIPSWSILNINKIDVTKVKDIYYTSRIIKIFDKEYNYTLTIEYKESKKVLRSYPLMVPGGAIPMFRTDTKKTQFITKRYKTEIECKNEIEEIRSKQMKPME